MTLHGKLYQRLLKVCKTKSRINNLNTMQTSANNLEKMQTPKVQTLQGSFSQFQNNTNSKVKESKGSIVFEGSTSVGRYVAASESNVKIANYADSRNKLSMWLLTCPFSLQTMKESWKHSCSFVESNCCSFVCFLSFDFCSSLCFFFHLLSHDAVFSISFLQCKHSSLMISLGQYSSPEGDLVNWLLRSLLLGARGFCLQSFQRLLRRCSW